MKWNLKKMWPAAAASLVAMSSVLSAADDAQMRNLENRVSSLEQRKGANGMINPPARPRLADQGGIIISGEALLWKPYENGLEFALTNKGPSSTTVPHGVNFAGNSKVHTVDFDYAWGFRVGLGADIPHDGWDANLMWTRLHSTDTRHVRADDDSNGSLYIMWDNPAFPATDNPIAGTVNLAQRAHGKWRLRFDMFDLELGREFYVSKWLTLRPNIGLRGGLIHQKFKTRYSGQDVAATGYDFIKGNFTNDFWGVGPRGGLNTMWGLGCGVSIYGDAAVSLMYGQFNVKEHVSGTTGSSKTNRLRIHRNVHLPRASTDLALGLRYDVMFDDDSYHFGIHGGYEQHMFFSQLQLMNPVNDIYDGKVVSNLGDLALHGWTLGARFDF
jgi:hypothetical protein